jgi:hypothetical protein
VLNLAVNIQQILIIASIIALVIAFVITSGLGDLLSEWVQSFIKFAMLSFGTG